VSNQITIQDRLEGDKIKQAIADILPKHLSPERMVRVLVGCVRRVPKLAQCDQASFFDAVMTLSQLGLEPDGRRAHLIPFENRKKGIVECQLIIDYKGLVELVQRNGDMYPPHADKVCEHDDFVYDCGEIVRHVIDFRKPRGKAYAYYAIAKMKDGGRRCEVMSRDEVDAIRDKSQSYLSAIKYNKTDTPWIEHYDEQAKKTVFKRLSKWLVLSPEVRDAIAVDDRDYIDAKPRNIRRTPETTELAGILSPPKEAVDYEALANKATAASDLRAVALQVDRDNDLPGDKKLELSEMISERIAIVEGEGQ
jgi:recombination protein RecT